MLIDAGLIVAGIVALYFGGNLLVTGAVRLSQAFGISPLVIGLTVVAFGTSSPEMAATVVASVRGSPELALGNIVGSNVVNLGLVLGLGAALYPLASHAHFIRREIPFLVFISALLILLLLNDTIGRLEGVVLLALLAIYLGVLLYHERESEDIEKEFEAEFAPLPDHGRRGGLGVLAGLVVLVAGAEVLVRGATGLAETLDVPEWVVAVSLVAFGTGLPELATTMVAALKREVDIVLGNLVGSNIFNILCVLGVAAVVSPMEVSLDRAWFDLVVMSGLTLVLAPILITGARIDRWEGAGLVAVYVGYIVVTVMRT
jgi:cation:H+ antiporter